MEPDRESARLASTRAYIEGLRSLSDEDLLLEFRFRDSMPDFRKEIEAEVRRRKGGLEVSAGAAG